MQFSALTPFSGSFANSIISVSAEQFSNVFSIKDPSSSVPTFYTNPSAFANSLVSTSNIKNINNIYGTLQFSDGKTISNGLGDSFVYETSGNVLDYKYDTSNVAYTVDKKSIRYDALRHLANFLFNTQYGVKIFNNTSNVVASIDNNINALFTNDNSNNMYGILNSSNGMDACNNSINNIGLQIYNAIQSIYPSRMNSLVAVDISNNIYKMPLLSGDSVYIILRINYPAGQGNIVGKNTDPPTRSYQIRLLLV
jgi:hypothetical protein